MVDKIPKTQKALVFDEIGGPLRVKEIDVPEPEANDVLVKVLYSGICHSDLHIWEGDFPLKPEVPRVGGHEGAGVVVKLGVDVKMIQIGDKVGIKWNNSTCLSCELCKSGFEVNCPNALYSGFHRNGTFQQYALIRATEAIRIPESVNLIDAAPIFCAGVTVYKAILESNVRAGQIIAIIGAGGGLGSLAIQYAKAMGLRVMAIDMGEKEQHCRELGAHFFVDASTGDDVVENVIKLTKGGVHGAINVATSEKPLAQAIQYLRKHSTIVCVGISKDAKIKADVFPFVARALTIKGTVIGSRQDTEEALRFLENGLIKIPIEIVKLEEIPKVFDRMSKGEIKGRVVVDMSL